MTPKEKVDQLMKKFEMGDGWGELEQGQKVDYALITVNEILQLDDFSIEGRTYWVEVKKILESF